MQMGILLYLCWTYIRNQWPIVHRIIGLMVAWSNYVHGELQTSSPVRWNMHQYLNWSHQNWKSLDFCCTDNEQSGEVTKMQVQKAWEGLTEEKLLLHSYLFCFNLVRISSSFVYIERHDAVVRKWETNC